MNNYVKYIIASVYPTGKDNKYKTEVVAIMADHTWRTIMGGEISQLPKVDSKDICMNISEYCMTEHELIDVLETIINETSRKK